MKGYRLIFGYLLVVIFVILSLFCLLSCRSTSTVETTTEVHKVSQLAEKMDSLVKNTVKMQQNFYERQTSLIDSVRHLEKNDSTHSVVVNEKGDTIRERIEVHHYIEREHNSEKEENEVVIHLQSQVDSLIRLSVENKALTDSLLKEHNKEVVIEKKPSLWDRIKNFVYGAIITVFIYYLIRIFLFIKRKRAQN